MGWLSKKPGSSRSDLDIVIENQNELAARLLAADAMIQSLGTWVLAEVDDDTADAVLDAFIKALQPDEDDDPDAPGAERRARVGEIAEDMAEAIRERRATMKRGRRR